MSTHLSALTRRTFSIITETSQFTFTISLNFPRATADERERERDTVRNIRLYRQYVGILVTRLRRKSTSQRFNCIICQALKMQTEKKDYLLPAPESNKNNASKFSQSQNH